MTDQTTAGVIPEVGHDSRLTLLPLSVVEQGDGFIVGNADIGQFVEVPPIAVAAIERLRAGATVGEVSRELGTDTDENVDVLDFARTLVALHFVSHVDDVPVATLEALPGRPSGNRPRWIRGPRPAAIRWLFGRVAWTLYAVAAAACVVVLIAHPSYRVRVDAFFFLDDPVVSFALLVPIGFALAAGHEAFHWLGACREGVAARFGISRRLYFLVFETDLTQLWSLPRHRRYGAMLAGMAFDFVILAATFGGRALIDIGVVEAPSVGRILAAIGAVLTVGLAWQFCIFMRTDMYAVMINALGCTNLWRVTTLSVARRFGLLSSAGRRELAAASPNDLRVSRWYSWLCLCGVTFATWLVAAVILPALSHVISWIVTQATTFGPISPQFWVAALLGGLTLLPRLLTIVVLLRQVLRWTTSKRARSAQQQV